MPEAPWGYLFYPIAVFWVLLVVLKAYVIFRIAKYVLFGRNWKWKGSLIALIAVPFLYHLYQYSDFRRSCASLAPSFIHQKVVTTGVLYTGQEGSEWNDSLLTQAFGFEWYETKSNDIRGAWLLHRWNSAGDGRVIREFVDNPEAEYELKESMINLSARTLRTQRAIVRVKDGTILASSDSINFLGGTFGSLIMFPFDPHAICYKNEDGEITDDFGDLRVDAFEVPGRPK